MSYRVTVTRRAPLLGSDCHPIIRRSRNNQMNFVNYYYSIAIGGQNDNS